jgi:mRNA interferase MazF
MAHSIIVRGSVVLIRYPFTDLSSVKVRPAIVLTPDWLMPKVEDVICLFVSSNVSHDLLPTDFVYDPSDTSFSKSGLKQRSVLRAHKLAVLHRALVLRMIGKIEGRIMNELGRRVQIALGLRSPQEPMN